LQQKLTERAKEQEKNHRSSGGSLPAIIPQALTNIQNKVLSTPKVKRGVNNKPSILGLGINQETEQEEEVTVGDVERRGGFLLRGNPRTGKTTLLINLILQDIEHGHGLMFLDPHRDAIDDILKRLPCREEDVILFDPFDEDYAFGLNLFEADKTNRRQVVRSIDYVLSLFAKLFTEKGDLAKEAITMDETMQYTGELLIDSQDYQIDGKTLGMTMAEIPLIFRYEEARARLTPHLSRDHYLAHEFWKDYERDKQDAREQTVGSTKRRISKFLSNPYIKHILGQHHSTIDFRDIINKKKIFLVKLSEDDEPFTKLIGTILISKLLNVIFSDTTPEEKRVDFALYCDEFQNFASPDFAKLFTVTGKWHIMPIVSHQHGVQLDRVDPTIRGAVAGAAIKVLYQLPEDDAKEFASSFAKTPQPAWEEEIEKESVQVLEEEKFERVEEVIDDGAEEIKTPVSNAVEWLLSGHSHRNPFVNEFFKPLRETVQTAHSRINEGNTPGSSTTSTNRRGVSKIYSRPGHSWSNRNEVEEAREWLDKINDLLYQVMLEKNPNLPIPLELFLWCARSYQMPFLKKQHYEEKNRQLLFTVGMKENDCLLSVNYSEFKRSIYSHRDYIFWLFTIFIQREYRIEEAIQQPTAQQLALYMRLWQASPKELNKVLLDFEQETRSILFNEITHAITAFQEDLVIHNFDDVPTAMKPGVCVVYHQKNLPETISKQREEYRTCLLRYGLENLFIDPSNLAWIKTNIRYEGTLYYWQLDPRQDRVWLPAVQCEIDRIVTEQKPSFEQFVRDFRQVLALLAQEPITSGSGLLQPRKRTQVHYLTHPRQTITHPRKTILHPQRTEQDMWNEMVGEFQDLPRRRAFCRMVKEVDGEPVVVKYKLFPFPLPQADTDSVVQARTARIIEQSHIPAYCRLRTEVEEEIAARQEELTRPLRKIQKVKTEEVEDEPAIKLSLPQQKKLESIRKALGQKDYDRFYNDPSVQHQDNLKRLLDKGIDAEKINLSFERWRQAGSPANVSPFEELIKTLLG